MSAAAYPITRLRRLIHGVRVNRADPPLAELARIDDGTEFVWAILPHAARSFSVSILLLSQQKATEAAVAYLYARMLDTYEDLSDSYEMSRRSLTAFADRFQGSPMPPAPPAPTPWSPTGPERSHLLLIQRCHLVDQVFAQLPSRGQRRIANLITEMASEMTSFSKLFEEQGGVLDRRQQVLDYCRGVIGLPALYAIDLLVSNASDVKQDDALEVSELIQLANITRDIESDLERGVAYHPSLRPHLGSNGNEEARKSVLTARQDLLILGRARASSYRRLLGQLDLPRISAARAAAVLMMLFTWSHYGRSAQQSGGGRAGHPTRVVAMVAISIPAVFSSAWSDRVLTNAERGLLSIGF